MKQLLYLLLAMLGFSFSTSCDVRCEYGTPHVNFRAMARVVDEEGKPIEGIRVAILHESWDGEYRTEDFEWRTGYTDYEGNIDATASPHTVPERLIIEDVDCEANGGEFETKIVDVVGFEQTEKGSGSWYDGAYKFDMGEVTLEHKTANENDDIANN